MNRDRTGYVFEDKDGRIWARITYTDRETGKRKNIKRRAATRTEGKEILKGLIKQFEETDGVSIRSEKRTFADLAETYRKAKIFPPTYVNDRKVSGLRSFRQVLVHLKPLLEQFGRRTVKDISAPDIQSYKLKRFAQPTRNGGQRSVASVNRELALLRSIFKFAKGLKWILYSPFEAEGFNFISVADENERIRVLTPPEESRLVLACDDPKRRHLKAIILTALYTGMRKGELLTLTWRDIDFVNNEITIRAFNTKTASKRSVGMVSVVRDELERLRDKSFENLDDMVFGVDDVKRSFGTACRIAGIEDFNFHDLRHTFISRAVSLGLPTAEIMRLSGHRQMKTFLRYTNPTRETTQRHVTAMERFIESQAAHELTEAVN
jgi:integrase